MPGLSVTLTVETPPFATTLPAAFAPGPETAMLCGVLEAFFESTVSGPGGAVASETR